MNRIHQMAITNNSYKASKSFRNSINTCQYLSFSDKNLYVNYNRKSAKKREIGMRKWLLVMLSFLILGAYAQTATIRGQVVDQETGEPLIGANVVLENTQMGAATDYYGTFEIKNVPAGNYTVVIEYVGYKTSSTKVTLKPGEVKTLTFKLKSEVIMGQTITVVAERAKAQETPVAFTDVKKYDIETRLASQDVPMVLNTTPSVYATEQGGGSGDARINVRGFNQRNVAIMINGVPVNDMENGWVYWSNWDGLGDAASSVQVQRGLTAINLAVPSVGGTINIITDPAKQKKGLYYKQEVGTAGFIKTTVFGHTGLINNKWALSAGVVRKIGDGLIDKTWTDAWAYYFAASYQINNKNRIEIYAVGAPQRHGQNLYKQNIATYDSAYAKSLNDYNPEAFSKFKQQPSGREFNQNWSPLTVAYNGQQFWNGSTHDRYDPNFINERENYYHKPQININWYSQLSDKLNVYHVFYYSGGKGGGSGTFGKVYRRDANGNLGDDDYKFYYGPSPWQWDWDQTIQANMGPAGTYYVDKSAITKVDGQSIGILRNSVNQQWTLGYLGKAYYKVDKTLTMSFGLDARIAQIEHFREIRDLLGGQFYRWTNGYTNETMDLKLGDKIDYNFYNDVRWIGAYGQIEKKTENFTAYATLGLSGVNYIHHNRFGGFDTDGGWISGYQLKGGVSQKLNPNASFYMNFGYISKVPIFDNVIDDRTGVKAKDPKNEKFISLELGTDAQIIPGKLGIKANVYATKWKDRAYSRLTQDENGNEFIVFLSGVNAMHRGFELEFAYRPIRKLRFDGSVSFGDWFYLNDIRGAYKDYSNPNQITEYTLYIKDLKVGDAPQTQFAFITSFFPVKGMKAEVVYRYYRDFYADFDPLTRVDMNDRAQSWKIPNYALVDLHFNYDLPFNLMGVKLSAFAHVFNLFDELYISDAVDNSRYNAYTSDGKNHKADDAEVFMGIPRYFNAGLKISY
jgi:hypothetical protein